MKTILFSLIILSILIAPGFVFADQHEPEQGTGIVPCGGPGQPECGYPELILLGSNIVTFLIAISIPLAAVAFAWAGFLYLTAAGNEEKIKKAHGIFWKVGIGLVLVLSAWLIVWFITSTLLDPDYIILKDV